MQLSCLLPHPETCPDLAAKLAATRTVHGVFGWCEEVPLDQRQKGAGECCTGKMSPATGIKPRGPI